MLTGIRNVKSSKMRFFLMLISAFVIILLWLRQLPYYAKGSVSKSVRFFMGITADRHVVRTLL